MTKSNVISLVITLALAAAAGFGVAEFTTAPLPVAFSVSGIVLCIGALIIGNRRQKQLASDAATLLRAAAQPGTTGGGKRAVSSARSNAAPTPAPVIKAAPQGNFVVTADTVEGQPKVIVTVTGFSGSDFKSRVRPALERVSCIKWDFPKNLKEGTRQMTGTVRGGTVDSAIAAVRAAGSRFGA